MDLLDPNSTVLHYRLTQKIASGGMGDVYRAEDTKLGRAVAIKVLPSDKQDTIARRRFLQEAQSASALNHPNIVTIHAIEEADDLTFIVMEFIEGRTLKELIELEGALPLTVLLDCGIQVADALTAAHEINLLHRDIKSANILITTRGHVKVLDFGLAKIVRTLANDVDKEAPTLANLTDEGMVMGTVHYMSPEQTRGEVLDFRSDIFSFGSVLYEAATRSLPFAGPSMLAIMHAIAVDDPEPPSRVRPELPGEFDVIMERAMAKDKDRRYASVSEMAVALRHVRSSITGQWPGAPIVYDRGMTDAHMSSFVGRGPELKRLEGLLQDAIEGTGRLVFITGEPGIGKTSLSDEFLRRARARYPGVLMSRGRCVEQYGTGEAYLPFLDAIGGFVHGPGREKLVTVMRTYAPTWCAQLPVAFSSTGSLETLEMETIGATKERMMREMGDALGMLATTSPIVLLLEDLHWADPSSVDLLRHLCQRINSQRVLIAGTFRPEDIERTNHPLKGYKAEMLSHRLCEEVSLASLGLEHIDEYLNVTFAPNDFPPEFGQLIHDKTEGHPLFATNLLQYLSERGDIASVNSHWSLVRPLAQLDLQAPESVRSMIGKKIDVLEEEERRTLQYASIEGTEFLSTVVAGLLNVDEVDLEERLAHLERTHRLIETLGEEELPDRSLATRYRFSHALYQNFLYSDLVNKRRVLLHHQAGELLAKYYGNRAGKIATQLAIHFERGRDFDKAIQYLIQAGDNATKLYSSAEAEDHYSRALSLIEKLPEETHHEIAVDLYQKRGAVNMALSRFSQSVDDYAKALEYLEGTDSAEREAAMLSAMALTLFFSHRLEEMEARANEAVAAARRAGSEELRIQTTVLMALKHLCYGELKSAKPLLEEAVTTARNINCKPGLAAALTWRACLYFFQTEYESAIKYAVEGRKLAAELRDGFLLLTGLFFTGLSNGNLGRMAEGLTILTQGIDMARRNGDQFWFPRMPNCIGWIHRELEDYDGALKLDQEGLEASRQCHVLEAEANSLINLGIDYTHSGKAHDTTSAFDEVHDIFARDAWFRWRYNIRLQSAIAEHWLHQGDLEQARQYTDRLHSTATEFGCQKYIAVAHKLRAEIAIAVGDKTAAEREFDEALNVLQQYPVPVVTWKIHAEIARLRSEAGDTAGAAAENSKAAIIINDIAASVQDPGLKATFMNSHAVMRVLENV